MYILVEIIHTEFQYISLIEMQKYNWNRKRIKKKENRKKWNFCPGWYTNRDKKVRQPRGASSNFCPGCQTRDKRTPLLSWPSVPGWETGTTRVSQPGQISVSVVVTCFFFHTELQWLMNSSMLHFINSPRQPCIIYACAIRKIYGCVWVDALVKISKCSISWWSTAVPWQEHHHHCPWRNL